MSDMRVLQIRDGKSWSVWELVSSFMAFRSLLCCVLDFFIVLRRWILLRLTFAPVWIILKADLLNHNQHKGSTFLLPCRQMSQPIQGRKFWFKTRCKVCFSHKKITTASGAKTPSLSSCRKPVAKVKFERNLYLRNCRQVWREKNTDWKITEKRRSWRMAEPDSSCRCCSLQLVISDWPLLPVSRVSTRGVRNWFQTQLDELERSVAECFDCLYWC